MTQIKIDYDLSELKEFVNEFENSFKNSLEAALPNTASAFEMAGRYVYQRFSNYLKGSEELPGIPYLDGVTSRIVQSLRLEKKGSFHYSVGSNNMQLESKIKGSKAVEYDMKQTHPYGNKSRVSKKGIPYLIIPFRWGTPNDKNTKRAHFNNFIPQKAYNSAVKGLNLSYVNSLKKYSEKNYKGLDVERQGYDWAKKGRLTEDNAWNDRSVGMVRMKDVTGSTYFTFRIISAKSPEGSWIYKKPAKPSIDVIGALTNAVKSDIDSLISLGLKQDEEMYRNM